MLCIDSQSVKLAPFVNQDRGIDENKMVNGRKRHLIVDTLGLVWGVVVHTADIHDGQKAHLLAERCLGYLDRMKKILVDDAYKKTFLEWVETNIVGLDIEFASRPPSERGFVPVRWRWVNERTFGWLNFFRRHSKDYKKQPKVRRHGFYLLIAKLASIVYNSSKRLCCIARLSKESIQKYL